MMVVVVLVVDDLEAIRDLVVATLEEYGAFQFLTAADGREALKLAAETRVDLVISDLEMPRMGGDELIRKLWNVQPNLLAILMSGNPDKLNEVALPCPEQVKIMHKPFLPSQLRELVDDLVSPKPAA